MQSARFSVFAIALFAGASSAGCSGSPSVNQAEVAGATGVAQNAGSGGSLADLNPLVGSAGSGAQGGTLVLDLPEEEMAGSMGVGGSVDPYPDTLPDGFTATDRFGGYRVGKELTSDSGEPSATGDSTELCGTTILAVIRDFRRDGENFDGKIGDDRNLVLPTLGADRKPVLASTEPTLTVKNPAQFADWYRTVDGVNKAYKLEIWFAPNNGVSSFQSTAFFPLDDQGFGNDGGDHNYHFTTEIHTRFKYEGGESFNFTGDDDVWVFINNQLVIDLGGVHIAEDASVDIDERATELGLVKGKVYAFDMFQNERHANESNFRADTNLNFVDCGTIVPEIPK
ncbi:MAG TPA: fibro-slime domain-containing protein [Polyangiaceae bacterium]